MANVFDNLRDAVQQALKDNGWSENAIKATLGYALQFGSYKELFNRCPKFAAVITTIEVIGYIGYSLYIFVKELSNFKQLRCIQDNLKSKISVSIRSIEKRKSEIETGLGEIKQFIREKLADKWKDPEQIKSTAFLSLVSQLEFDLNCLMSEINDCLKEVNKVESMINEADDNLRRIEILPIDDVVNGLIPAAIKSLFLFGYNPLLGVVCGVGSIVSGIAAVAMSDTNQRLKEQVQAELRELRENIDTLKSDLDHNKNQIRIMIALSTNSIQKEICRAEAGIEQKMAENQETIKKDIKELDDLKQRMKCCQPNDKQYQSLLGKFEFNAATLKTTWIEGQNYLDRIRCQVNDIDHQIAISKAADANKSELHKMLIGFVRALINTAAGYLPNEMPVVADSLQNIADVTHEHLKVDVMKLREKMEKYSEDWLKLKSQIDDYSITESDTPDKC
ncbi:hypothetical protein CHUAL_008171 [Chamberlinius hualienensis]